MSDDEKPNGTLPSWWPSDDKPAAAPPKAAEAKPEETPAAQPSGPGSAYIANKMPSWWKPEYQKAASVGPSSAPEAPAAPPPAPAPPPPTPAATQPPAPAPAPVEVAPAPPPPPPARPPSPPPMPPSAPTMVLGAMPVAPPAAILTVTAGPDTGFKFRIKPDAVTSIGRGSDSDVVLDDPATSRKHAHIKFAGGKYVLNDLGSANGTLVNDQRVTEKPLSDGDVIRIGQNVLRISISAH